MTEEKIVEKVEDAIKVETQEKPFEFDIDKRIPGALFLRQNGKAEFFPQKKREKGGMTTTNKTDTFTVQESEKKVKITISFEKETITFNNVLKQVGKLVKTLQNMKIV